MSLGERVGPLLMSLFRTFSGHWQHFQLINLRCNFVCVPPQDPSVQQASASAGQAASASLENYDPFR